MQNLLSAVRQLKEQGMSIRETATQLSISKYEVEKALQQLKALEQRPDSRPDGYPDDCLDDESYDCQDDEMLSTDKSAMLLPPKISPKDLPSEWYKGVTRFEADFIIEYYHKGYNPSQTKAYYMHEYTSSFISLEAIYHVIEAYESRVVRVRQQEEARKEAIKIATKKAADEQMLEQFNNFVGEDILAFLLWFNDDEEIDESDMKSCVSRAGSILNEVTDFCRRHKLNPQYYEPYAVISDIKEMISTSLRKRKETELSDRATSFLGMINHRSSLDRYFWKMVDSSTSRSALPYSSQLGL